MTNKISTVALSATSQNERILSIGEQCLEVLSSKGLTILIDKNLSNLKSKNSLITSQKKIIEQANLLIAIGGDGTMLNSARNYGSKGIPVLGINLGNLGFLADIDPENLTTNLLKIIDGNYVEDKRFFLEANIEGKKRRFIALNEIVIHSGAIAQLIEFELFVNNIFVYRQKGDGLIVSSPTGSTAYSLSGGGPIVHPEVDAIIVLPMLPQRLSTSPLIIKADDEIRVEIKKSKANLSFDGHEKFSIENKSSIKITKAKSLLKLIHPQDQDFYASCRNKLGWSSG